MWWSSSSGRVELQITKQQARYATHSGPCDAEVLAVSLKPKIARQLNKLDPALLARELKEYGAWDATELADHEQNLQRILWLACGDLSDQIVTHMRREHRNR